MSRYSSQSVKSTRPSQAIEDSKKKTSLLKDGSWIRKSDDEDEDIDRDPNFGRSVLGRYRSSETLASKETEEKKPTRTTSTSSVQALAKRFGGSQDNLASSSPPPSNTSSYTRRSYSSVKSPLQESPKTTTPTTTVVKEEPKKSSTTTTVTKDGKTTETTVTTTTTTQSVRSPVIKSPTKTETFSERVRSSSKGSLYQPYSPTRTTKAPETTVTSSKTAEDKLYDTLIPSPIKDDYSPKDSAEDKLYDTLFPKSIKDDVPDNKPTVSSTMTVESSPNGDGSKTTTTTTAFSNPEDKLYDTLIPKSIKDEVPSSPEDKLYDTLIPKSIKDDVPSSKTTIPSTKTVESSPNGDGIKTTAKTRTSMAEDDLYDTLLPKGITSNLSSPVRKESPTLRSPSSTHRRSLHEKDLCSSCHKPFNGEAKMVLDDMNINCHATCFKCEVCNSTLGHMKAGDSMWIYKHRVHCERCFENTRDKWRR